jgi:iron complex transport system substrate-binding protein
MRRRTRGSENFRRARALLCCALLVLAALGPSCGGGAREGGGGGGGSQSGAGGPGAKGGRAQRIISLTPSTTEILSGVGAFGRVVAVSDYCTYPPEVKDLPRIGGWQNTNLERVASFRADLIVMTQAQEPFIRERVEALGARTLVVRDRTLDDALSAITEIGRATGDEAGAEALLARTRATLEEVRARTRDLPRRRVLCIVDRLPGTLRGMYSANEGSFLAQLIEIAGGESIVPPGGIGFGQIQKEAVLELDPEVIIDLMMHKTDGRFDEDIRAIYSELSDLRAVREGRVYSVREETVLHPSQFVGDTARRFAELIHPEVFRQ